MTTDLHSQAIAGGIIDSLSDDKIVRLAQALEFTDDAIVLVDADGSLEYMNTAAQKLAGDTSLVSPGRFDGVEERDQAGSIVSGGTDHVTGAGRRLER